MAKLPHRPQEWTDEPAGTGRYAPNRPDDMPPGVDNVQSGILTGWHPPDRNLADSGLHAVLDPETIAGIDFSDAGHTMDSAGLAGVFDAPDSNTPRTGLFAGTPMPNYAVGPVDLPKFNFYPDRLETDNALLGEPHVQALLATIRGREGQEYNKIVGGQTFNDYSQHPNTKVGESTAAGAYQFTHPTWTDQQNALGLPDFTPQSQDQAAVDILRRLHATDRLLSDDINGAVFNAGQRWQAFPTTTEEEIDPNGRRRGINHPAKGTKALTNTLDQIRADYLKNLR